MRTGVLKVVTAEGAAVTAALQQHIYNVDLDLDLEKDEPSAERFERIASDLSLFARVLRSVNAGELPVDPVVLDLFEDLAAEAADDRATEEADPSCYPEDLAIVVAREARIRHLRGTIAKRLTSESNPQLVAAA